MLFKTVFLKHFAISTGKHLYWDLFLIKLQAFSPSISSGFQRLSLQNTSSGYFSENKLKSINLKNTRSMLILKFLVDLKRFFSIKTYTITSFQTSRIMTFKYAANNNKIQDTFLKNRNAYRILYIEMQLTSLNSFRREKRIFEIFRLGTKNWSFISLCSSLVIILQE